MNIQEVSNYYINNIYPYISDTLGQLTDLVPFALGELLAILAGLWLLGLVWDLLRMPFHLLSKKRRKRLHRKVTHGLRTAAVVLVMYVLGWFLPFFAPYITFSETEGKGYTYLELEELRNYVVEGLNEAAASAERDEAGHLVVPDTVDQSVVAAMRAQAGEFPRLSGYYPKLKEAWCTDFMQWMRIGGFTYPYTMEITGNGYDMKRLYYPVLYAHESSHHQGYYQEDEADFLSYIALSVSDDPYVRYSAFYQMYYVVEPAFRKAAKDGFETEEQYKLYLESLVRPVEIFRQDMAYDQEIYEREYARRLIHPPERLKKVSERVGDTGWKVQANILKEKVYGGSLGLMLQYYEEKGVIKGL